MAKNEAKANKENKHFFRDFKAEIKKVIWPTSKQLVNSTTAVIVMVLIVAVTVFVLDLAFDAFNKYALTGLQEMVQSTSLDDGTTDSEDDASDDTETDTDVEVSGDAETETTDTETDADSNE